VANLKVSGLTQKIHLLNDNQIACWAGDYLSGKRLIEKLKAEQPKKREEFEGLLQSELSSERDSVSLIVVTRLNEAIEIFHHNCRQRNHPLFDHVAAAGTGTSALWHVLDQFESLRVTGTLNPLEGSVALALKLAGHALGGELLTGGGLRDRWGGAFEVAAFVGGKAQKIDNILYCYWFAQRLSGKEVRVHQNPQIFKVGYSDGLMLMRWCFTKQDDRGIRVDREGCHVITEFLDKQEITKASDLSPPDFRYTFLFSEVLISEDDKLIGAYLRTSYHGSGEQPLKIEHEDAGKYDFYVKHEYVRALASGVSRGT
jgi:hypothetical protein